MKYLPNAVVVAAALAIAAPALAQNAPMSPSAPKAAAPATAMPSAAPAQKHHAMRHHAMRHHAMGHGRMMSRSRGGMTEDLNRQELSRIQGGGAMPPAPAQGMASPSPHAGPSVTQPVAPPPPR